MLVKDLEELIRKEKPVIKSLSVEGRPTKGTWGDAEKIFGKDFLKNLGVTEEELMMLSFTISTGDRDRDKDIIDPKGWTFDNFKKNPVMLWAHRYDGLPIGKAAKVWRNSKDEIKAAVIFQPDSNYQPNWTDITGSMIYRMYDTGFLNAVSVGFDPLKWEPLEKDEESMSPFDGVRFRRQDLLEFSGVPVPSNAWALADRPEAKEFRQQLRTWAKETLKWCGECTADETKNPLDSMKPYANEHAQTFRGKANLDDYVFESKPYNAEHACRLRSPDEFQSDSFRRTEREHEGKTYYVIMGRLTGETSMTEQAYRYDKGTWTVAQAKSHCKDHEGTFEAAREEDSMTDSTLKDKITETVKEYLEKRGRVISADTEKKLAGGVAKINDGVQDVNDVLAKVQSQEEVADPATKEAPIVTPPVGRVEGAGEAGETENPAGPQASPSSDVPILNQEGTEESTAETTGTGVTAEEIGALELETGEELIEVDVDALREELDLAVQSIVDETLTDLGLSTDKPAAA